MLRNAPRTEVGAKLGLLGGLGVLQAWGEHPNPGASIPSLAENSLCLRTFRRPDLGLGLGGLGLGAWRLGAWGLEPGDYCVYTTLPSKNPVKHMVLDA